MVTGSKTKWPLNPDKNGSTTDSVGDLMAEDPGQVTELLKRWGAGEGSSYAGCLIRQRLAQLCI